MRKFGVCLALTGATVWLTGCGMQFGGQSSTSRGGLAVVDLDKVAEQTGKSIEMRQALQLQENAYKQELVSFRNKATAELEAKAKDLKDQGENAPDEAKRDIVLAQQKANNILAQAQNAAGAKLNQLHQNQIATFRQELKPILQETAAKRGLSIVVPKNDGLLLAVDPGVDITDEVIKAYQAKRPAPSAAPAAPAAAAPAAAATSAKPARTAAKEAKESREFDDSSKR